MINNQNNKVVAVPGFELPLGMILSSISIFVMMSMVAYFYLLRREQMKLDKDTFLFSMDEKDKNNYSKKIKFLDD